MTAPKLAAPPRPSRLVDADRIPCPRCAQLLRRVTAGEGSLVYTCDHKLSPVAGQRFGANCGQHVYVRAYPDGSATVIPITRDEGELLAARGRLLAPREALELLGILRQRTPAAAPVHPCARCSTPTPLFDLYGGVCRSCNG